MVFMAKYSDSNLCWKQEVHNMRSCLLHSTEKTDLERNRMQHNAFNTNTHGSRSHGHVRCDKDKLIVLLRSSLAVIMKYKRQRIHDLSIILPPFSSAVLSSFYYYLHLWYAIIEESYLYKSKSLLSVY